MPETKSNGDQRKQPDYPTILRWIGFVFLLVVAASISIVILLRWINPPTTSFMIRKSIQSSQSGGIAYRWVDWDNISDYVKIAAITSEDQRFPQHNGFDFEAIEKALQESRQGDRLRGASTITQQTAKNLFLWPGRSIIRKGIEAYFTMLIELFWSKKRILEVYLNVAQFGRNTFGVEAASRTYFHTSAAHLNMAQSALLVTALPSPERYDLADPSPYMVERRNWVLRQMFHLGNTSYLGQLDG